MNVYAVRFIPKLKLRFCQFFGIASSMAFEQLFERLDRIEHRMDRFEGHLRKFQRKQMTMEATSKQEVPRETTVPNPLFKKKPKVKAKPAPAKALPRVEKPKAVQSVEKAPAKVTPLTPQAKLRVPVEEKPQAASSAVVLLQLDQETQETVQNYFGKKTSLISVDQVEEIDPLVKNKKVPGIIFDRALLSDAKNREALEGIRQGSPKTKLVGISSYLTLAFTQSMPQQEDFATFLSKPLTTENLAGVFEEKGSRVISDRG